MYEEALYWGENMKIILGICIFLSISSSYANLYWGDVLDQSDFEQVDLGRPSGAYKKLMQWKLPQFEKKDLYQCLIYKVPSGGEKGRIYIRTFDKEGCQIGGHFQEELLGKTSQSTSIKALSNYSGLHLQFIDGDKIIKLDFPQAGEVKRWKTLQFNQLARENIKGAGLNSGDYCLKWKKTCEPEVIEQCSSCPSGQWSESMNYKECPSKVTAICGERSCGGKNQPACLKMVSLKYPLSCEEALEFVVCAPMLDAHCEGTGEIICR